MKLFSTITSERGKAITKSGNEYIVLYLQDENRQNRIRMQVSMNKTGAGDYTGTMHVNLTDIQGNNILYAGYLGESKLKTAEDIPIVLQAKVDAFNAGYGSKKHRAIFCEDAGEFVEQEFTGTEWLCLHDLEPKTARECEHNWHATHDTQESGVYIQCSKCKQVKAEV